ncbi:uncharacterized protein F5891DRAFT_1183794 [Suillus fuscotomentosus]|uniref:Uncharacterized protein n=1 Tax=Suillus fuscotomentosus TaxID=1912939 RepID=A0AAD4EHF9_9AGAM|nr:uncharacterized protein F5891DRAFT_1183794 [Suillus fuscotomentosus]KAG1905089.1 hypothetical protein F5891DRAFT_1183794 [Suillus fuscotomentosus]
MLPVAVHRQSFPKPGEPHVYLSSDVFRRGVDPFPIHRQSFEEVLPSLTECLEKQALSRRQRLVNVNSLSVGSPEEPISLDLRNVMIPDASQRQSPQSCGQNDLDIPIQSQTLASPGSQACDLSLRSRSPFPRGNPDNLTSPARLLESPESHVPVVPTEYRLIPGVPSSTSASNSTLNHPQSNASQHRVRRLEHKIRGLDQMMHWFDSRGCEPLLAPPPCESLECGDLYIHQSLSTSNTRQIWIWSAQESWEDAQEHQAHPLLPMHRLWFGATGEPRWVTQKTISTYKGRLKVSASKTLPAMEV